MKSDSAQQLFVFAVAAAAILINVRTMKPGRLDFPKNLEYSHRYSDDHNEFRHVHLTREKALWYWEMVNNKVDETFLSEDQWRRLGLVMSPGWQHYGVHSREPHILLFCRPRTAKDQAEGEAAAQSNQKAIAAGPAQSNQKAIAARAAEAEMDCSVLKRMRCKTTPPEKQFRVAPSHQFGKCSAWHICSSRVSTGARRRGEKRRRGDICKKTSSVSIKGPATAAKAAVLQQQQVDKERQQRCHSSSSAKGGTSSVSKKKPAAAKGGKKKIRPRSKIQQYYVKEATLNVKKRRGYVKMETVKCYIDVKTIKCYICSSTWTSRTSA